MPVIYRIDHEARVVVAAAKGTLTDAAVFGYQQEVWSRPVAGYGQLIDITHVTEIALPAVNRVRDLAKLLSCYGPPGLPLAPRNSCH
jgi:hypothetical protein